MSTAFPVHPNPARIAAHLDSVRQLPDAERISTGFLVANGFSTDDAGEFIALAKSLGMVKLDGSPGPLFERMRTSETLPREFAWAVVNAYEALFRQAPSMAQYEDQKVGALVAQLLDVPDSSSEVTAVVATFRALVDSAGAKAIDRAAQRQRRADRKLGGTRSTGF